MAVLAVVATAALVTLMTHPALAQVAPSGTDASSGATTIESTATGRLTPLFTSMRNIFYAVAGFSFLGLSFMLIGGKGEIGPWTKVVGGAFLASVVGAVVLITTGATTPY